MRISEVSGFSRDFPAEELKEVTFLKIVKSPLSTNGEKNFFDEVKKDCSPDHVEVRSLTSWEFTQYKIRGETEGLIAETKEGDLIVFDRETELQLERISREGQKVLNIDTGKEIDLSNRKITVLSPEQTTMFFLSLENFSDFAPDTESTDRKIDNASILHPVPPTFKAQQKEQKFERSKLTEEQMVFNLNHNPKTDPKIKKNAEDSRGNKRADEEELEEMEENRQTLEHQRMETDIRHQEEGMDKI